MIRQRDIMATRKLVAYFVYVHNYMRGYQQKVVQITQKHPFDMWSIRHLNMQSYTFLPLSFDCQQTIS